MLEGFLEGFSVLGRGITFHFQELLPEQSQTMIRTSSPTSPFFFFSRSCRSITASLDVDHIKKKKAHSTVKELMKFRTFLLTYT